MLEHEKRNEAALRATEIALEILRDAGSIRTTPARSPQRAVDRDHAGHERARVQPEVPADERAEMRRRNEIELAMLPAAKYPRLIECAVPMTACDDPEFHYRFGIGLFIDGVKAAARS